MPIIPYATVPTEESYPGVERAVLVNAGRGSKSLLLAHLTIQPGASVSTHIHPDTEEAMMIVEGTLEAVLGDQAVTLGPGDTVLAPAGVKHGFVNRSSAKARLVATFPKTEFQRVAVD
tara:strand:+ start:3676 stop:4029 length:354 start_codon:yes stop_codon:yes gene_type:complete